MEKTVETYYLDSFTIDTPNFLVKQKALSKFFTSNFS